MKKISLIVFTICIIVMCTSCATIMSDDETLVSFTSEPSGADVYVDGYKMGETPCKVFLENDKHTVDIKKDGYEVYSRRLKKDIKLGWQVLDVFVTGFVGNIVDIITPNGWEVSPDEVHAILTEL